MVEQVASQSTDVTAGVSPAASAATPIPYVEKIISPKMSSASTIVPSFVAGFLTFLSRAEELAHKNLSTLYITQDLKELRSKSGRTLAELVDKNIISDPTVAQKEILDLSSKFEEAKVTRFARTGFGSFKDRLKVLRPHQWREVVFQAGLTVVGSVIAIDALKDMMASKKREAIALEDLAAKGKEGDRNAAGSQGMQK